MDVLPFFPTSRNKLAIKRAGGLPLLARLVKMRSTSILVPVIGTLQVGVGNTVKKNRLTENLYYL